MRSNTQGAALAAVISMIAAGAAALATPSATAADWSSCLQGSSDRQAVFARAARVSGVPEAVLLGVGFLESRWDDHSGQMSTSGGFGPMHLTDLSRHAAARAAAKGDGASTGGAAGTLSQASGLLGVPTSRLRADDVANICGGAAVLASYRTGRGGGLASWSGAVASYSGASDGPTARRFVRQVFAAIASGRARTTNDGQRVVLRAVPGAHPAAATLRSLDSSRRTEAVDCPKSLGCESVPAPYEWYGAPKPTDYGNHDVADRPEDLSIDYIVIHDTEGSWDTAMDLVTDPTYLAWNYTVRSADGHIAQHLDPEDVGWQAGNWYVNMHSIGIEHEGFAEAGGTWFTEAMYRNSARLVRYLAKEYDVPLDRAHIIGHDQVPGVDAAHVRGMHWDPGPYWDWEHYMDLLGAPITRGEHGRHGPHRSLDVRPGDTITVAPGFEDNPQTVTGCGGGCPDSGTNFVYLRSAPSDDAPLVSDPGLHPGGSPSTTQVSDIGARAVAGQVLVVAERSGDWLEVWYLGQPAWLRAVDAHGEPVVQRTPRLRHAVVTTAGADPVPVYGRAYPEEAAYPETIPVQPIAPLQYTLEPGQRYAVSDASVPTDYYYAKTFDDSLAGDHTVVSGEDEYLQLWFGHRIAYVRAADVRPVSPGHRRHPAHP